jgi:hypothetical protein
VDIVAAKYTQTIVIITVRTVRRVENLGVDSSGVPGYNRRTSTKAID